MYSCTVFLVLAGICIQRFLQASAHNASAESCRAHLSVQTCCPTRSRNTSSQYAYGFVLMLYLWGVSTALNCCPPAVGAIFACGIRALAELLSQTALYLRDAVCCQVGRACSHMVANAPPRLPLHDPLPEFVTWIGMCQDLKPIWPPHPSIVTKQAARPNSMASRMK